MKFPEPAPIIITDEMPNPRIDFRQQILQARVDAYCRGERARLLTPDKRELVDDAGP